jgi:hypothetical protein
MLMTLLTVCMTIRRTPNTAASAMPSTGWNALGHEAFVHLMYAWATAHLGDLCDVVAQAVQQLAGARAVEEPHALVHDGREHPLPQPGCRGRRAEGKG